MAKSLNNITRYRVSRSGPGFGKLKRYLGIEPACSNWPKKLLNSLIGLGGVLFHSSPGRKDKRLEKGPDRLIFQAFGVSGFG